MSNVQALVHDVFGTVVDWRGAVAADGEALAARKGITGIDWQQFADEWRGLYAPSMNKVRTGELPWTNLDVLHRMALDRLLGKFSVRGLDEADKESLNLTWHRLKPWPDSVPGLDLLRKSGEFPMSDEELDDTAATVYEGVCGGSGPPGANQWANAARDRG